jgi:hypothetical protein
MPVGAFNGVLIQATEAQIYHLDALEILDATGTTVGTALTTNIFGDHINNLTQAAKAPDGVVADTAATAANKSFLFMHHSAAINQFRVNIWKPASQGAGDVKWVRTFAQGADQIAGGAAISSVGSIYLTFRQGTSIFLLRYDANGAILQDSLGNDLTSLESAVSAPVGSASVAIDLGNDDVFIATTRNAGDIRLYKFVGISNSPSWTFPALSGAGVDRVEPNGLALDLNGDLILAGGFDAQGLNKVQHYIRKHSKVDGSDLWVASPPPASPADINDTYWYAVATGGTNDIFAAGNLSATLGVGPIDIHTQRLLDGSPVSVTETWNETIPDGGSAFAIGRSVGVDGAGNVYVAGFYTHPNLDSVILRYGSGSPPGLPHLSSTRPGDDEILDIAVEPDGTIYAVGYETNVGQGQDLVLLKIAPNNAILWKRTVDESGSDDRGVSVMTTPTHVIVVGELTVGAGNKDIHVRKYVK